MTGRMYRRAQRRVAAILEPGEAVVTAVRAAPLDEDRESAKSAAASVGFPLGLDNLLVVTDRRIVNLATGFFGRVGGVRGELPIARVTDAELGRHINVGDAVSIGIDGSSTVMLAVRRADQPARFVAALGGKV